MRQQLFLHKLAFHLAQLHHSHAAAIGREFPGCVLFEAHQQVFGSGCGQGGEELFFENGEGAFQRFKILCRGVFRCCCFRRWTGR